MLKISQAEAEEALADVAVITGAAADRFCGCDRDAGRAVAGKERGGI